MTQEQFASLMQPVIEFIAGKPVDRALADALNQRFPASGADVMAMEFACISAIKSGWMCTQGGPGRRFGRVIQASPETLDLSVDVVDLTEIVGPLHRHPLGEICLVMPVDETAKFDGKGRGWCVYGPNSAHRPTVKGGRALVLYLLPSGKIEFVE
ncbi:P-hydroxylaminobenzoate lyase [Paramagnetospirillum magnetotacticum MS-1]|uniref:p-hydroxylaminobenzoate lyase n=1 Tax=Paramagnetospirillum magnetotacticum MS-1 TaxID=272627 RepID=A0A0C2YKF0_PARME|nr:DUF4863 family protein [Paramagnetospirillum magnetotacticum]KIM00250.1 P-hydroxylaminobenzoate lyase [Paramagnetospirillum magnetotacticum MS-1]